MDHGKGNVINKAGHTYRTFLSLPNRACTAVSRLGHGPEAFSQRQSYEQGLARGRHGRHRYESMLKWPPDLTIVLRFNRSL